MPARDHVECRRGGASLEIEQQLIAYEAPFAQRRRIESAAAGDLSFLLLLLGALDVVARNRLVVILIDDSRTSAAGEIAAGRDHDYAAGAARNTRAEAGGIAWHVAAGKARYVTSGNARYVTPRNARHVDNRGSHAGRWNIHAARGHNALGIAVSDRRKRDRGGRNRAQRGAQRSPWRSLPQKRMPGVKSGGAGGAEFIKYGLVGHELASNRERKTGLAPR